MDRRTFIRLTAVSGTGAALASCGHPEHQLVRFVPEENIPPGIAQWKPSICPLCASGCGLIVRVMDADADVVRRGQRGVMRIAAAKKVEGDPAHPISRGHLCARGQAAIQITYHPDRLTQPLKRTGARGTGTFAPVGWDEAIATLASRLNGVSARDAVACVTTGRRHTRREALLARVLDRFGAPPPIVFDVFSDEVLRRANGLSFGHEQLPTFDLARARLVVSFGADLLGTWNAPVAQAAAYGEMRRGRRGARGMFVQVEPRLSQTGANADSWLAVRPGTEGVLALGLACAIMQAGGRRAADAGRAGMLIDGWEEGLPAYGGDRVEAVTGISAARVERLALDLAANAPAVAIVGGAPLAHTNGLFTALAVNALNALLGAVDAPGGLGFTPRAAGAAVAPASHDIRQLASSILAGSDAVQVLLVDGANPVFGTPRAWRVREALAAVPFVASFGSFLDDTGVMADLILPDHSFLESWVEASPESGSPVLVTTVAAPVMHPLHDTRSTVDVLLDVAARLHPSSAWPWKTYEHVLRDPDFSSRPSVAAAAPAATTREPPRRPAPAPAIFSEPVFDGSANEHPLHLLPYPSPVFGDGSAAHLPWLQEMPDPMTSAMWSSWVEINPRTADALGVSTGDLVNVTSAQGSLRLPAFVSPGIAPDVVAIPVGQGHETFTRYASGRGANPLAILGDVVEPSTGTLAWAATRVRVTRAADANGDLILFAGALRDNPPTGTR